jgi:hypothetical protein
VEVEELEESSPFRSPDGFDTVLQSSDGLLFRVHRFILNEASVIFRDMLVLAQPPAGDAGTLALTPIVMQEDSQTLDTILHFIYPSLSNPEITELKDIPALLHFSDKFFFG